MEAIDEDHEVLLPTSEEAPEITTAAAQAAVVPMRATTAASVVITTGVLFGRSVRSGYACLHLYVPPKEEEENPNNDDKHGNEEERSLGEGDALLIRLQFGVTPSPSTSVGHEQQEEEEQQQPVQLRSHIRRFCKPGDLLSVMTPCDDDSSPTAFDWKHVGMAVDTQWQDARLVIHLASVAQAQRVLRVTQRRYWSIRQIQACQGEFCGRPAVSTGGGGGGNGGGKLGRRRPTEEDPSRFVPLLAPSKTKQHTRKDASSSPHGGGLLKRTQGDYLKNFLAHMVLHLLDQTSSPSSDPSTWAVTDVSHTDMHVVRDYLNQGTGVLDVAGGSGHVSMALGLSGIHSTIVDPRDRVGKLPGRDRKVWNRAWKRSNNRAPVIDEHGDEGDRSELMYCQPVQYKVYRAWFGRPPEVRHEDQTHLPVCGDGDDRGREILSDCRAIAALHPDEATDAIVDTAVERRIPFVIVPCCVFYRLFPHRRMPGNPDRPVSTYEDLLDYLQAKDESIQRTLLPFEGANTLLWSIF